MSMIRVAPYRHREIRTRTIAYEIVTEHSFRGIPVEIFKFQKYRRARKRNEDDPFTRG